MRIERIDAADDAAFQTWYEVFNASFEDTWPGEPGWQLAELRARALDPGSAMRIEHLVAWDGEAAVGAARIDSPQRDNTHVTHVFIAPGLTAQPHLL